jgi:hypothetical protein
MFVFNRGNNSTIRQFDNKTAIQLTTINCHLSTVISSPTLHYQLSTINCEPSPCISIIHPTSYIRHHTSYIRYHTSAIIHHTSLSYIIHPTSYIRTRPRERHECVNLKLRVRQECVSIASALFHVNNFQYCFLPFCPVL